MKLYELSIYEFLQRVDSQTATPGGGSVSALAIAEGISLIRMVGHLTIPKKKFIELTDDIKLDYMSRISALEEIKILVMELIEKDTQAFNRIMEAYKLPKNTDEEKLIRGEQIKAATINATDVPLETAKLALRAIELAEPTLTYANKSAVSDFGVGINLLFSGLKGAILNVKTNMHQFSDDELASKYYIEAEEIYSKAKEMVEKLEDTVNLEFVRK